MQKRFTKKLLELINVFSKSEKYGFNIKNQLHLYNLTMSYLKITYNIKKNKILRNRESYKILMKEIKEDTNKWKDIPCS